MQVTILLALLSTITFIEAAPVDRHISPALLRRLSSDQKARRAPSIVDRVSAAHRAQSGEEEKQAEQLEEWKDNGHALWTLEKQENGQTKQKLPDVRTSNDAPSMGLQFPKYAGNQEIADAALKEMEMRTEDNVSERSRDRDYLRHEKELQAEDDDDIYHSAQENSSN